MSHVSTSPLHEPEPLAGSTVTQFGARLFVASRRQRWRETGWLVLGIAVAAGVIWGTARLAFPRGASPDEPPAAAAPAGPVSAPAPVEALPSPAAPPAPRFEGAVASINRTVQMRAGGELAWSSARVGRKVHTQDAIQTLAGASAVVKVKRQGDIHIGENSLVVFEASAEDDFLAGRAAVAAVSHGALAGHLQAVADRDVLGIRLPNATVRVQGTKPGQAADFSLQVNDDQSASIVILQGRGRIRAGSDVRTLGSGEGAQISADGRQVEVLSIPPVPELLEPAAGAVVVYQKERPQVGFHWRSSATVDDYRFVLAADSDFRQVLVDERLTDGTYTHSGLGTGRYYWKVSARRSWLESPATGAAQLDVERDIDAAVRETLAELYQQADSARELAARAEGVLVFPRVVKGGLIVGGEYGEGALLSAGRTVDYYALKSASLGLQMGGQTRKVALLFMTPEAYQGFLKSSRWKVGVDGSVTLAALGVDKKVDASTAGKPIIAFVFSSKGLMYNLTLEGSRISRMRD
jgi:lipid-binding SYLF domain-containing protein